MNLLWQGVLNNIRETIAQVPWQVEDLTALRSEKALLAMWNLSNKNSFLPQTSNYRPRQTSRETWEAPQGFLKMIFDGASRGNPRPGGAGGIFKDAQGEIVNLYTIRLGYTTNNGAKLVDLLTDLQMAKERGYPTIV